jgi:hypothetical protein
MAIKSYPDILIISMEMSCWKMMFNRNGGDDEDGVLTLPTVL